MSERDSFCPIDSMCESKGCFLVHMVKQQSREGGYAQAEHIGKGALQKIGPYWLEEGWSNFTGNILKSGGKCAKPIRLEATVENVTRQKKDDHQLVSLNKAG